MVSVNGVVVIQRQVEDVFSFVTRNENGSLCNSAVRQMRKRSEGPVGLGTVYSTSWELPRGFGGKYPASGGIRAEQAALDSGNLQADSVKG